MKSHKSSNYRRERRRRMKTKRKQLGKWDEMKFHHCNLIDLSGHCWCQSLWTPPLTIHPLTTPPPSPDQFHPIDNKNTSSSILVFNPNGILFLLYFFWNGTNWMSVCVCVCCVFIALKWLLLILIYIWFDFILCWRILSYPLNCIVRNREKKKPEQQHDAIWVQVINLLSFVCLFDIVASFFSVCVCMSSVYSNCKIVPAAYVCFVCSFFFLVWWEVSLNGYLYMKRMEHTRARVRVWAYVNVP